MFWRLQKHLTLNKNTRYLNVLNYCSFSCRINDHYIFAIDFAFLRNGGNLCSLVRDIDYCLEFEECYKTFVIILLIIFYLILIILMKLFISEYVKKKKMSTKKIYSLSACLTGSDKFAENVLI